MPVSYTHLKNILQLINAVVGLEKHELIGTCQEIVQKSKMELNPNYLTKYLKQNKRYLDENHITFTNDRTGQKRTIKICLLYTSSLIELIILKLIHLD